MADGRRKKEDGRWLMEEGRIRKKRMISIKVDF